MKQLVRLFCEATGHAAGRAVIRRGRLWIEWCPRCRVVLGVWLEERCL